jgi:pilus assembly protein CpaE
MSRVVLIGADGQLEHQARVLLGDEAVSLAPGAADVVVSQIVRLDRRPELILIGTGMPTVRALGIAAAVRELADTRAMVTSVPEARMLARQEGVEEFLDPDVDLERVDALLTRSRAAVERVRQTVPVRESGRAPGWITVVGSPKGGVGKTTVAANLAVGFALNEPGQRVVLVDLDLQFGDAATVLGLQPLHTVADALGKAASRDEFVLRGFLAEHASGIAVLCAPVGPATADHLDAARIGHLLHQLAADFDQVVVDTAPGLGEHALAAIDEANSLVMVGGLDMPSLRGLRSELDVLRELELLPASQSTVLNAVDARVGISVADAQRIIGGRVDVAVPRRRAVQVATNYGIPVVTGAPRDPAARELRRLARRLVLDQRDSVTRRGLRDADRKEKAS